MEKNVNINSKKIKKDSAKFNINFKRKDNLKNELVDFYNKKIKKLHIILLVIAVLIFVVTFIATISSVKSGNYTLSEGATTAGLLSTIKEGALLDIVIIIAGITPYCFLSIIGMVESIVCVNNMALSYALGKSFVITLFLGGIIEMIGVTLCVAIGLYYCRLSSKKNKYYHHSDFGMDDLKAQLYEIKKDKQKLEEINKKKEEKNKKIEECNIKIPYLNFVLLGLIAFIIQVIGILIAKI